MDFAGGDLDEQPCKCCIGNPRCFENWGEGCHREKPIWTRFPGDPESRRPLACKGEVCKWNTTRGGTWDPPSTHPRMQDRMKVRGPSQ